MPKDTPKNVRCLLMLEEGLHERYMQGVGVHSADP